MKGILLAGGTGSRLFPLTKVTNKHLLSIYNKPMIYYPLSTLKSMGIRDIMVISGTEHCGHILQLLGSGKDLDISVSYRVQDQAGGIAEALKLTRSFAGNDQIAVILGDNIFEDSFDVSSFSKGARLFLKETNEPERFGVAEVSGSKIIGIEEKPKHPKSNLAVTGLYLYDSWVWSFLDKLKPSARNELEITDLNNYYIKEGWASYEMIKGEWTDAGTFESLYRANEIARSINHHA